MMTEQIKRFIGQYESKTSDMLFLVEDGCYGAVVDSGYCLPCVKFLASYDPYTKEFSEEPGYLDWIAKENRRRSGWGHNFRPLTVYRVRVSRHIPAESDEKIGLFTVRKGNRYRIIKVLGRSARCGLFASVKEHYLTKVVIDSPIYGSFTLDRRFDTFECVYKYGDNEITLELGTDTPDGETADRALESLHSRYPDISAVDERLKTYAASTTTELANDWSGCDDDDEGEKEDSENRHHISEDEFARRITLSMITVNNDGSTSFWYDDDNMFWGHVIVIDTDSEGNPSEPYLMG